MERDSQHPKKLALEEFLCHACLPSVFAQPVAVAAGGQPWKPRLQRLADARQLAPFEKLVLEVLVGCHVSPSVQRTFLANKAGSSMDDMSSMSPVTVCTPCQG